MLEPHRVELFDYINNDMYFLLAADNFFTVSINSLLLYFSFYFSFNFLLS